jgi:hypothetical protein
MATRVRELVLKVPEEVAQQVERLEKKSLPEVLDMVWGRYLSDGRRNPIETKKVPISWPLDWYEKMQTTWGRGMIPHEVRKIVLQAVDTDKNRPLSPIPEWKDIEPDMTASKPKPLADRLSYVQPVMIPMDWYVRLLEVVGDGWVSTYIKYLVWSELAKKSKKSLSVPQRMSRFMD